MFGLPKLQIKLINETRCGPGWFWFLTCHLSLKANDITVFDFSHGFVKTSKKQKMAVSLLLRLAL